MEIELGKKKRTSGRKFLLIFLAGLTLFAVASVISSKVSSSRPKIGVVEISGIILDSRDVVRQLTQFSKDSSILGIIIRIDSPGGSVAPSQEIYNEVLKIKKSDKKIVASLGSLAASGGYYIASAANRIFANPGTLTGSIGVIMAFSNVEGLMDKIGLEPVVVKSGKFKDTGSPVRPMSKEEREFLQSVLDDVHEQFIEAVSQARQMDIEAIKTLADGRIYTGRQALNHNLVDELGGFEESLAFLTQSLGIKERPELVQEKGELSFFDWLLQGISRQKLTQSIAPNPYPTLQFLWHLG